MYDLSIISSALSAKRSQFQSENKEAQQAGDAQEGEGEEEGQEDAKDASQEDEEEDDVIYQVIPRQADEGMYTWVSGMSSVVGVELMWEKTIRALVSNAFRILFRTSGSCEALCLGSEFRSFIYGKILVRETNHFEASFPR